MLSQFMFWMVLMLALICWTVCRLAAVRVKRNDSYGFGAADAQTMQELDRSLRRMEDRIQSLETILMDRSRKGSHPEFE